jgi:cell division protein FtsI/penicillin-binding protein 2
MQRVYVIFGAILLLFLGVTFRLFYWQIIRGSSLKISAASQHTIQFSIQPQRGEIVTSDGSALVSNQPAYFMYAEPEHIDEKDRFAREVAPLIGQTPQDLFQLITDQSRKWVPLARNASIDLKTAVEKLSLDGIGFDPRSMRFYPESSMAAHLLGFVGQDEQGMDKGYFCLEGFYDRELAGKSGSMVMERDAKGGQILIGNTTRVEPEHGRTLVLWLDRSIQYIVERHLKEAMAKYGAKAGSVIVMDPKTGGILAMSSYPNYDPALYQLADKSLYSNPAVAKSYEPGSTFKPLIMAAGLEEKVITNSSQMNETGPVTIGEYTIRTWNNEYHGQMSMTDILKYSSNVGMVYVAKQLGNQRIISYIQEFGLGEKTGIDLEDEQSPALRDKRSWAEIDYATASFGQGIAATPLQIIQATSALANNGVLMRPQVVKAFRDSNGKETLSKPKVIRTLFSPQTAKNITEMMVNAAKYGEAKWAAPKGYKVAGKTGTAQIPVAGHYDEEKTIASFVGFAPADDPKFAMLVVLTEPQTSQWGSETAAPLFFVIAKEIFQYLGIPPTEE